MQLSQAFRKADVPDMFCSPHMATRKHWNATQSWSLSSLFRLFRLATVPHVSASSAEARGDIISINCPALERLCFFCDGEMSASVCTSSPRGEAACISSHLKTRRWLETEIPAEEDRLLMIGASQNYLPSGFSPCLGFLLEQLKTLIPRVLFVSFQHLLIKTPSAINTSKALAN